MTPQEALATLNALAAQVSMPRADHERAVEAVNVLAAAIEPEADE